jgi:hypothetical protein
MKNNNVEGWKKEEIKEGLREALRWPKEADMYATDKAIILATVMRKKEATKPEWHTFPYSMLKSM